jgi:hypothetical protein
MGEDVGGAGPGRARLRSEGDPAWRLPSRSHTEVGRDRRCRRLWRGGIGTRCVWWWGYASRERVRTMVGSECQLDPKKRFVSKEFPETAGGELTITW